MSEKAPGGEFDQETAELAKRLSELDFTGESRVREPLRRRLVERGQRMRRAAWWERWSPVFAPAGAVAVVVAALFVSAPVPAPFPEPPSAAGRMLVRGPRVGDRTLVPERIFSEDWGAGEVAVAAGPASLDKLTAGDLMETVKAEVAESEKGRTVRWRVGNDVFVLESRRTTMGELFPKPGGRFD